MIDQGQVQTYIHSIRTGSLSVLQQIQRIRDYQVTNWDQLDNDAKRFISHQLNALKGTCAAKPTQPAMRNLGLS